MNNAPAVGFIGLGRMGSAIAARLLATGRPLVVYNRTAAACAPLVAQGARAGTHPQDVATPGGLVFSSLATEEAVAEVCGGERGLLRTLRGGTHVSMSTLSPEAARRLARAHAAAGVDYVSAPVQGRPAMAADGQLVGWVSGPRGEPVQQVLAALCRQVIWLGGDPAQAVAAKLALNFLMFANVELFAEALAYVSTHAVDRAAFATGVTDTAFAAPLFRAIAAGLQRPDDTAQGSDLALACKDLGLLVASSGAGARLQAADRMHAIFQQGVERGWGALDPVAVRRLFEAPTP